MPDALSHSKEIEKTLQRYASSIDKAKAAKLQKYIGTQLTTYGLTSSLQSQICKIGFSFHTNNPEQTFQKYHSIFHHSPSFEGKQMAFLFLDKHYKHLSPQLLMELLPSWVTVVDNWAHSDSLSKFLTRLLEHNDTHTKMLTIIKQWNSSDLLWERRQSLVSLYYYTRTKKECVSYKTSEKLIFNLLHDNEYYVQKAVGWALRESYNAYPNETYNFIEQHIKSISSTAFTTCIEKMTDTQKQTLKAKRKK